MQGCNIAIQINWPSFSNICSVLIIDLDAHQGNGHEKDFANDGTYFNFLWILVLYICQFDTSLSLTGRVYILDMYNAGIYPFVRVYIITLTP